MTGLQGSQVTSNDSRNWFVVYVEPGREQLSATLVAENGYEVYLPKYQKFFIREGVTGKMDLPLFSRYFFCRLASKAAARLVGTPGVVKLIGFRNGLGTIRDEEIQTLKKLAVHNVSPFVGLARGRRVRVKNGPLRGIEGVLLNADGTGRLIVSMELIQQSVSVVIDNAMLQLIPD